MPLALWVAGTDNGIRYTTDGSGWRDTSGWYRAEGVQLDHASVAYGNTIWVAYGQPYENNRSLAYSIDGITWRNTTGSRLGYAESDISQGEAVAYGTDASGLPLWVAVGDSYNGDGITIILSRDGIHWTDASSGFFTDNADTYCVAYGKDATGSPLWVAAAAEDYELKYSADGFTWIDAENKGGGGLYVSSIAYGIGPNGTPLWVGTLTDDTFTITSTDGRNWYDSETNLFGGGNGVLFSTDASGDPLWVATNSNEDDDVRTPIYSTDGINWEWNDTFAYNTYCVAYDGTTYLAGGNNGQLLSSSDGRSWTVDISGGTGYDFRSMASTRNLIPPTPLTPVTLVRATFTNIQYTTDGDIWHVSDGVTLANLYKYVAYGNGIWVALGYPGDGRALIYSPNGVTWKNTTGAQLQGGGESSPGGAIAYGTDAGGSPLWVAVGNGFDGSAVTIVTSPNGITWVPATSGFLPSANGYCVAYGKDENGDPLWVAGSASTNSLKRSDNGFTWTDVTGNTAGGGGVRSIAYGYGPTGSPLWIGVTNAGTITSTNGRAWFTSAEVDVGSGVAYGNGIWVAANASVGDQPLYSCDGIVWRITESYSAAITFCVAYDGANWWYAGGNEGQLLRSSDGKNWSGSTSADSDITSIASTRSLVPPPPQNLVRWVAGRSTGLIYSTDGIDFYPTEGVNIAEYPIAAYGDGKWVALGNPDGGRALIYSEDGVTWSDTSGSQLAYGGNDYSTGGVAYGTDATGSPLWVAVGYALGDSDVTIVTSPDGIRWDDATSGFVPNADFYCLAYGKDDDGAPLWVAGSAGPNALKWSADGFYWIDVTGDTDGGGGVYSITYGLSITGVPLWIGIRDSNPITSIDGRNWYVSNSSNPGERLAYDNGLWVSNNTGGLSPSYSYNANSFTTNGQTFSISRCVAYDGTRWLAGGDNGQMLYSPDGKTWDNNTVGEIQIRSITSTRNLVPIPPTPPQGPATWVAGTQYGLMYSTDGSGWYKTNADLQYANVAYGNGRWVAVGSTEDGTSILYSPNGVDWENSTGVKVGGGGSYDSVAFGTDAGGTPMWVAVGGSISGNTIIHSPNGKAWVDATSGFLPDDAEYYCVAYGKDASGLPLWVAGSVGPNSLKWSADGRTWEDVASNFDGGPDVYSLTYGLTPFGRPLWIGTRDDRTLYMISTDGRNWYRSSKYNEIGAGLGAAYGYDASGTPIWVSGTTDFNTPSYSFDGAAWITPEEVFANTTVCVAYDGATWLAGGYESQLLSSSDGKSWNVVIPGVPSNLGNKFYTIASTRSLLPPPPIPQIPVTWVAGTELGNMYSIDGSVWYNAYGARNDNYDSRSIAYGNGTWVSLGEPKYGTALLYSTDGITWNDTTGAELGGGGTYGQGVAYGTDASGSPLWVAIGYENYDNPGITIVTSDDGITWTGASSGLFPDEADGYCVAYGKDENGDPLWVAASEYPDLLKWSADGVTWEDASGTDGGGGIYSIAYGLSPAGTPLWVAVGDNNYSITSTNGREWVDSTSYGGGGGGYEVAYGGGLWVAANTFEYHNAQPSYSGDGKVWRTKGQEFTNDTVCVAYDGTKWLAGGYEGQLLSSSDGTSWTVQTELPRTPDIYSIVYARSLLPIPPTLPQGPATWVAGTDMGIIYSTDGSGWYDAYGDTLFNANVVYGNNRWVAIGTPTDGRTLMYSMNGVSWENSTGAILVSTEIGEGFGSGDVAYGTNMMGNHMWVAVGNGVNPSQNNTILYSTNGIDWRLAYSGYLPNGANIYRIAYGKGTNGFPLWVAGSTSLADPLKTSLKYSTDGLNWENATVVDISGGLVSITFGYGPTGAPLWVGSTLSGTVTSTDGMNWYSGSDDTVSFGVAYAEVNGQPIFVSANAFDIPSYSVDGIVWTPSDGSGGYYPSFDVAYDGTTWLVVGEDSQVLSSSNGTSWTILQDFYDVYDMPDMISIASTRSLIPPPRPLTPVTWVAGTDAGLRYSTDGSSWYRTSGAALSVNICVAYGFNRWVALGEPNGGRALIYSEDGVTWKDSSGEQLGGSGTDGRGGVAYGADNDEVPLWVAIGRGYADGSGVTLVQSRDGKTWTKELEEYFPNAETYFVTYGKDDEGSPLWVAGSASPNALKWSSDGFVWTDASYNGDAIFSVAYGYGPTGTRLWVGTTNQSIVITSPNGKTWTDSNASGNGLITYGDGLWVCSNDSILTPAYSVNGTEWRNKGAQPFPSFCVAYDGTTWLAGGDQGQLLSSSDGKSWMEGTIEESYIRSIASTRSLVPPPSQNLVRWVAGKSTELIYSTDGVDFYPTEGVNIDEYPIAAYGDGKWVALGNPDEGRALIYSLDGVTWRDTSGSRLGGSGTAGTGGVAYGSSLWVAVGRGFVDSSGVTIVTSPNGITWVPASSGFVPNAAFYCLAYGKDDDGDPLWVAGSASPNALKWSADGFTWTDVTGVTNGGGGVRSIAYGYGPDGAPLWVGSNDNGDPITSIDGRNWYITRNSNEYTKVGIAYSDRLWVSVEDGESGVPYFSFNGKVFITPDQFFTYPSECVAYDGITWLAGGNSNQLLSSSDGKTWGAVEYGGPEGNFISIASTRNLVPSPPPLPPSPSGPATWVAGTVEGIKYSTDGSGWYYAKGDTLNDWINVAYGNTTWVAIGTPTSGRALLYSTDGVTWIDTSGSSLGGGGGYAGGGIAYGTDASGLPLWVAVGRDNAGITIVNSRNGITWTDASSGFLPTYADAYCVAYGKDANGFPLWVAASDEPDSLKWSANGFTWTDASCDTNGGGGVYSIAYGYGPTGSPLWVGLQWDNYTITSTDGKNWFTSESNGGGTSVAYGDGLWVSSNTNYCEYPTYSGNGKVWSNSTQDGFFCCVAYDGDKWLAGGYDGELISSSDGKTWAMDISGYTNRIYSLASTRNLLPTPPTQTRINWILASEQGLLYSYDGLRWLPPEGRIFANGYATDVAYGNNKWVAVGYDEYTISWSYDGAVWQDTSGSTLGGQVSSPAPLEREGSGSGGGGYYSGVAYGDGKWVAVGTVNSNGTSIVYSTDGINWLDASGVYDTGTSVVFGKSSTGSSLWISGGYSIGSPIKRSSDGILWQDVSGFPIESSVYGIAYGTDPSGNSLWNIVGRFLNDTNILWSTNGTTWNDASGSGFVGGGGFDVNYNGNRWIATGYSNGSGKTIYSLNGRGWTDTSGSTFTDYGYGLATYNNTTIIAVGKGVDTIQWSSDGIEWNSAQGERVGVIGNGIASFTEIIPTTTTTTQAPPPCFVTGTRVLTPKGYVPVEDLQTGDMVLTSDKRRVTIKMYSFTIQKATKENAPYKIPAGALGFRLPKNDIHVSPRHAVKDYKGRWQIPKFLGTKAVQYGIGKPVTYYHIECPNFYRDNLIVEETEVESFKNKQGSPGVLYIWDHKTGGWERLAPNAMTTVPKNPKTFMIYSY